MILLKIIFNIKQFLKTIISRLSFLKLKIRKKFFSLLRNHDFTIISNNCWGGMVYQETLIEYKSPTVGLYFYPKDYLKFLNNLKYYLSLDIKFIKINDSKYFQDLRLRYLTSPFPIGILEDIEIIFLHYKNEQLAYQKWNRRKKRINFNNLIIKMNDQNGATDEDLFNFLKLPFKNKILFTVRSNVKGKNVFYSKNIKNNSVKSDMRFFLKPLNIINYLNNLENEI
jgi:uncharacterized protein (DUF1919 family)